MNWFVWRQSRRTFLTFGVLLAVFAAIIVPTGNHFWHTYQHALTVCTQNPATPNCSDLADSLFQSPIDRALFTLVPVAIFFMPLLFGMFWGAPLLATEYAEGTNKLVWTQRVSRRKWLTVKLAWALIGTAAFAAAFAALSTWWSSTPNDLLWNRFGNYFSSEGIVPVAYSLFATAFGIMVGAWFRKAMVAAGMVLGVLFAVVLFAVPNFARPHYAAPVSVTAPMGPNALDAKIPTGAWVLSRSIADKNGKTFDSFDFNTFPPQCQKLTQDIQVPNDSHIAKLKAEGIDPVDDCLNQAGYHQIAKYQPAYRYWDFQRIESGIYLGLTALAVGGSYWLVLKRDA